MKTDILKQRSGESGSEKKKTRNSDFGTEDEFWAYFRTNNKKGETNVTSATNPNVIQNNTDGEDLSSIDNNAPCSLELDPLLTGNFAPDVRPWTWPKRPRKKRNNKGPIQQNLFEEKL